MTRFFNNSLNSIFEPLKKIYFLTKALFFKSPWDQNDDKGEDIFSRKRNNFDFNNFPKFEFNFRLLYVFGLFVILWLLSGIYQVNDGEEAMIVRFGKFARIGSPGLNYKLPSPIEEIYVEKVNKSRRIELGYRSNSHSSSDNVSESFMLTGDENIIKLNCDVMWHISNLRDFLFNVSNPDETLKAISQSVIREVISCTPIFNALSDQKQEIADNIQQRIQNILDSYKIGITIEQVQLLKAEPPEAVLAAYRDVQTARSDKESQINQAQTYRNDILPNARGKAAEMVQQAEGYKQESIARAEGDVKRFSAILQQYAQNKQITKDRLTLDAVEEIMSGANKTIVGSGAVLPHMQLDQKK
jgi:membrane protease subunit HflK